MSTSTFFLGSSEAPSLGTSAIQIGLVMLFVAANGFFVASEFALARVRKSQAEEWVKLKRPGAKSVLNAVTNIDSYLAATQLGITLASLGLGAVGERSLHAMLEPSLGESAIFGSIGLASIFAFTIITALHVIVGELAPKSAAIAKTDPMVLRLMPVLHLFYLATKPIVWFFNGIANLLLKPFGIPPASEAAVAGFSQDELIQIIRESGKDGLINQNERKLTENAFEFDDRRINEVMVPRKRAVILNVEDTVKSAAQKTVETGVTRMPLCEGDGGLDNAVGIVHAKDLLACLVEGPQRDLRALARPVSQIGDTVYVDKALRKMRQDREHLSIVIDEHGTAVGIVTVEDIIEELVGEIEDEFDKVENDLIFQNGDVLIVDGEASVSDLIERFATEVETDDVHEATVGGHLLSKLGRLPEIGEQHELFGHLTRIEALDGGRISKLVFFDYIAPAVSEEELERIDIRSIQAGQDPLREVEERQEAAMTRAADRAEQAE